MWLMQIKATAAQARGFAEAAQARAADCAESAGLAQSRAADLLLLSHGALGTSEERIERSGRCFERHRRRRSRLPVRRELDDIADAYGVHT